MSSKSKRIAFSFVLGWLVFFSTPAMANSMSSGDNAGQTALKRIGCIAFERRIHFRRGSYGTAIRWFLTPRCQQAFFVLRARAGQHMRAELASRGPATGQVTFPNGGGSGQTTSTFGVFFDGTLPATGDYHLRLSESNMADRWIGSLTLFIAIVG